MAGTQALIARIFAVFALLIGAVIALHGHIPGMAENSEDTPAGPPAAVTVALMPVLLTVAVVVLIAGVIASQHRLPLAMPEPDADEPAERSWKLGRMGLLILFALAIAGVLAAIFFAIYFLGFDRTAGDAPASRYGHASESAYRPPPGMEEEESLTGTALFLVAAAAGMLVAVAVTGLAVVTVNTTRRERRAAAAVAEPAQAPPSDTDSLVAAAEAGLAAMNVPGQDPRTAIIACYLAMERALLFAQGAAPLASDTPMEVLARAFEYGALRDTSAQELVALFEEARFSPHDMMAWQRMRAEQLLRIVLADLQGIAVSELGEPVGGAVSA